EGGARRSSRQDGARTRGDLSGRPRPRAGKLAAGCSVCCKSSWNQLQDLCRLAKLSCPALGISKRNLYDFEVEYLCDYKKIREQEYYLVKWRGYPDSESTWEPRQNLKCVRILKQFHKDLERELLRRHHRSKPPRHLDPSLANYLVQKAKQRRALRRWEQELNAKRSHLGRITVENEVDLDGPPRAFVYINEYRVGEGITLNQVAVGCECQDCLWAPAGGCCPGASLHKFAYNDQGQVRLRAGLPIYECNSRCRCGYDCPNRVVQKGIRYDLCIFRTDDGRGWGVRTLEKIRKNSFVMEYVGEVGSRGWAPVPAAAVAAPPLSAVRRARPPLCVPAASPHSRCGGRGVGGGEPQCERPHPSRGEWSKQAGKAPLKYLRAGRPSLPRGASKGQKREPKSRQRSFQRALWAARGCVT
uniref:[histone H3]-lysine(9) N-trimethyltransferase n=1 Tax=Sus scrofa TaxID=9823 RepID=A0A8D0T9X2_PIG